MKKSDFIKKRKDLERGCNRVSSIYITVYVLILLASWFLVTRLNVLESIPGYVSLIYLALFFVFSIGSVFILKIFENKLIQQSGLKCQQCKEPLIGQHSDIAIATDGCPLCGNNAFN
jgi:hypothetical protein